jgi:hypothetical protein
MFRKMALLPSSDKRQLVLNVIYHLQNLLESHVMLRKCQYQRTNLLKQELNLNLILKYRSFLAIPVRKRKIRYKNNRFTPALCSYGMLRSAFIDS